MVVGMLQIVDRTAVLELIPVSWTISCSRLEGKTLAWRHLREGAAAADAGSVQLPWQVLMMVLRRTSPVRLSRTKWPRMVAQRVR
jgi:hypothetical protein